MALVETNLTPQVNAGAGSGATKPITMIDKKHPEYKVLHQTWYDLSLLYASGWALKQQCERFLYRRPKEVASVYQARCNRFTHENHLGTALDWYSSELFQEEPYIEPIKDGPDGKAVTSDLKADDQTFYEKFLEDCDRGGRRFVDLFREVFQNLLLYGRTYVLADLPATQPGQFANLAEQRAAGALDPYLSAFTPMDIINWELDAYGNLEWVVISRSFRKSTFGVSDKMVDRWYYYDRTSYQVWERERDEAEQAPPADASATLISEGNHRLAKEKMVPVICLKVSDGLWLANRAMLAAIDHLNTDNVLSWALFMSALAMPVIMTDGEITPPSNEAGYIHLPENAKYEWSEPEGTSFSHLADRCGSLTEDIFRSFYLLHQGRSGRATPTAQSGVSKQLDMMPSKDVLRMFGDLIRGFMQRSLKLIALLRQDGVEWDVRGFEFKEDISDAEVQTMSDALTLGIPSETLEKEVYKNLARRLVPDANPSVRTAIFKEIDTAASKEDRDTQSMLKRAKLAASVDPVPAGAPAGQKLKKPAVSPDFNDSEFDTEG